MPKQLKVKPKKTAVTTTAAEPVTAIKAEIKDIDLSKFAHEQMVRYANSVNEDRAVPEYHDGFKPVQRRVLWAAYSGGFRASKAVEKSARLVGDTLGKYHPHGDTACYAAIVNMVNMLYPMIDGEGNFGDFFNPKGFAAMRYTNVRLSKFSERVFFDPFYMPMQKSVANYDDKDREPLHLVSLLPTVLFNTTFAIGVGLTARFPRFTLQSVVRTIEAVFKGQVPDAKFCADNLEFTTQYRGRLAKGQKRAVRELFEQGTAKLVYDSVYHIDAAARKIIFTGFAPFANFEDRAAVVSALPDVVRVANESRRGQKIGEFAVYLKPRTDVKALPQIAEKVAQHFSAPEQYFSNITVRGVDKKDQDLAAVKLKSTTVPELIAKWCAYRVKLEVAACAFQIEQKDRELRRLEVMRIAVSMRKAIIQALDKKLDDEELAKFLAKLLKVSVDEARFILDLKVRQLKALEDQKLVEEIKKLKAIRAEYIVRRDKPAVYCARHVQELLKELQ